MTDTACRHYLPNMDGIRRYVDHGIMPGHFVTALLENNLKESVSRADIHTQALIPEYVMHLYNCEPAGCWGSPAKVQAWVESIRA